MTLDGFHVTKRFNDLARENRSIRNSLSLKNRFDSFTIKISTRSSLKATLKGIQRKNDINLELRNSTGAVIAASKKRGKKNELINVPSLEAGTYSLRAVLKKGSKTSYRLNYSSAPVPPPPDFAGNTPGTARDITISSTSSAFSDYVGPEDNNDFYRFTVGAPGFPSSRFNLSVQGDGTTLPGTIFLRDSLNSTVRTIFPNSFNETTIEQTLPAGTYFLQVEPTFKGGNYTLNLAATSIQDLAGNTSVAAQSIAASSTPSSVTEFVGVGDQTDFYTFTVAANSTLSLSAVGAGGTLLGGGIDVRLRNSVLNEIKRAYSGASNGGGVQITNQTLTPGTYYVQIETFGSGDSDYTLTFSATPS